jgi:hypothetical protein
VAIFWWTGKGYLTAVIVVAVFSVFGVAIPIGSPFLKETPVYWGIAAVVAAAVVQAEMFGRQLGQGIANDRRRSNLT